MDIKKTAVSDIHRLIQKDYKSLYQQLQKTLGNDMPFADIQIGSGFYVWSDARCEWHQMIAASSIKQDFVVSALTDQRQAIAQKLGDDTAEKLFTYPDESYIYFNDDDGEMHVLLTGWGFKKPVFGRGTADKQDINVKTGNPVSVSFSFDGVLQPNYEFGLRLAKQVKRFVTNDFGVHQFDDLQVGEHFTLVDLNSNREFSLEIVAGQSEYDFDITNYTTVTFSAMCDGQPISGEAIDLDYNGRQYKAITDAAGNAAMQLPLFAGETLVATMRGEKTEDTVNAMGNHFDFLFNSPTPPELPHQEELPPIPPVPPEIPQEEPKPEEPKIKIMVRNAKGMPLQCQSVRFAQQDHADVLTRLDAAGNTYFDKSAFTPGSVPVTAFIQGSSQMYAPITFTLESEENVYLLQELEDKSSTGTILLEILSIVLTLIFLCVLWYVFSNFVVGFVSPFIASLLALL